jgi:hypothetical protein
LLLAAVLSACGSPPADTTTDTVAEPPAVETEAGAPAEMTVAVPETEADSAATDAPSGAEAEAEAGLSGPEFVAQRADLDGQEVTIASCSLDTTVGSTGHLACRVTDESGADVKDADGLPVDVFLVAADLSPEAQAYIDSECPDSFCATRVSGTLDFAEGTGFSTISNAVLTSAR